MRVLYRFLSFHIRSQQRLNGNAQSLSFRCASRTFQSSSYRYGGYIPWTVRLPNEAEFRMRRGTWDFPHATIDSDFLACSPPVVDRVLNDADWDETKSPPYEFEGVPKGVYGEDALYPDEAVDAEHGSTNEKVAVYAPSAWHLMPGDYGFIVTDFVTKSIITCQDYCDMTEVCLREDMTQHSRDYEMAMRYFNDGRIVHVHPIVRREREEGIQIQRHDYVDFEDFLERIFGEKAEAGFVSSMAYVTVKPPKGWQVQEFNMRLQKERKEAYETVKGLGFVLTEREEKSWQCWFGTLNTFLKMTIR